MSLGWLQPVKLTNVLAVDQQGNLIFKVANVTTSKSLFALATSGKYGELNVHSPVAYVQLRPDGSNLEDALANYIQPTAPDSPDATPPAQPTALPRVKVNVHDGQAFVSTNVSTQVWQVDQLNAVAETTTDSAPLILDAQCRITPGVIGADGQTINETSGAMTLTSQVDRGADVLAFNLSLIHI